MDGFLSREQNEDLLRIPDLIGGKDLTLFGGGDGLKKSWFAMAEARWSCGHVSRDRQLLHEGVQHPALHPDGNWRVLDEECLRLATKPGLAHQIVDGMAPQLGLTCA